MKAPWGVTFLLVAASVLAQDPAQPPGGSAPVEPALTASQLVDLGSRAKKQGRLPDAAKWFCRAAAEEARYANRCDRANEELSNALAQFEANLNMGRTEIAGKDYRGALRDLRKITFGPHREEALDLVEQARLASGEITPEQVSQASLQAAEIAYAKGDFDKAESLLRHVHTPTMEDEAHQLLTNVQVYRNTMREADALAGSGDYKAAALKYSFAALIQPNGPGRPREHEQEAEDAAAKAEIAQAQQVPPGQPSPPPTQAREPSPMPPMNIISSMGMASILMVARRQETQGDLKGALQIYSAALKLDGGQKEAAAGKKRVLAKIRMAGEALEGSLSRGLDDFYGSRFVEADARFRQYLQGGGQQYAGAAHFFLGASLLTQAILTEPNDYVNASTLRRQARKEFMAARRLGYQPVQSATPPKILAQWSKTGVNP